MGLLRRSTLAPLDEAAAYARCHGTRSTEVRIVKLPPRRRRYDDVLANGEELRRLFERRSRPMGERYHARASRVNENGALCGQKTTTGARRPPPSCLGTRRLDSGETKLRAFLMPLAKVLVKCGCVSPLLYRGGTASTKKARRAGLVSRELRD